jgi:outer membrane protein
LRHTSRLSSIKRNINRSFFDYIGKRMKKTLLVFALALGMLQATYATDLMDIYKQALDNDPQFKQAYNTYMSNKEAVPQAMSALLPQVTLGGEIGHIRTDSKGSLTLQSFFNNEQRYNYNQYTVQASQAVFNYAAWKAVQSAKASVRAAYATFNAAAQDLIRRVSQAYFNVLLAKDTLEFSKAKKRANKRQLDQAQQRFKVGLDAITSVYEAQAAYDQSVAEVIADDNNLTNQFENLRKFTNHTYYSLSPLRGGHIPLVKPEPANVDEWVNTAIKQNYNLIAAKLTTLSAQENISAQSSGNWPVLSIIGNTTGTHNELNATTTVLAARTMNSQVALSLNFPIFQGGLVISQGRQAQYDYQSAYEQLQAIYRDTIVGSRIAYNTIIDGISKIKADKQTIVSQQNSLNSTEAQFKVGTRTMVDVVNAQRRLFEAQTQLANDQYGYISAIIGLKYLSGTLNVQDIEKINSWLATTRINKFPPRTKKPIHKTK